MTPEGARELGVVAEAETIGNLGDRQTIGGIAQLGVTGVEPLVPDPLANGLFGVAKEVVQVARRDAAGTRDQVRIEIGPAEISGAQSLRCGSDAPPGRSRTRK